MVLRQNIVLGIATLLLLSTSTYADLTKTIYIETVGAGKFEVVYHRALSNATGAVLFGLIGAGIQSGVEADKDKEKTNELIPLITKGSWRTRFLDSLNDKLEAKGFSAVWINDEVDTSDGVVLKIYPEKYGFKLVDTSTRMVSAFVTFKARVYKGNSKNNEEEDKEEYYITNKNQHTYQSLLVENSPANSDLVAVLEKAGKRLANKIIYNFKE